MQWIHIVVLAHSITLLLLIALLAAALYNRRTDLAGIFFAGLLLGCIGWSISNGISEYLTLFAHPLDLYGSIGGIGILITAWCVYGLSETLPDRPLSRSALLRLTITLLITIAFIPFTFSSDWVSNRRPLGQFTTAEYGTWYYVLSIWDAALVLLAALQFFLRRRRENSPRTRQQLAVLSAGVAASFVPAFVFAFVLPLAGIHALFFLGVDSSVVFVSFVLYSILFQRLFDIRTALLRYSLRIFLSVITSFAIYTLFFMLILDRSWAEFSWELALALSLYFIAAILFTRRLIPAIDRVLFRRPPVAARLMLELIDRFSASHSMHAFLAAVHSSLKSSFVFREGALLAIDFRARLWIQHPRAECINAASQKLMRRLSRLQQIPAPFYEILERSVVLDPVNELDEAWPAGLRLRYPRVMSAVANFLRKEAEGGMRMAMPLTMPRRFYGWLLLGDRDDDMPYMNLDLDLMDALRPLLAMLIHERQLLDWAAFREASAEGDLEKLTGFLRQARRHFGSTAAKANPVQNKEPLPVADTEFRQIQDRRLIFCSQSLRGLVEQAESIPAGNHAVLIHGETGTGKELFARLIHQNSEGSTKPFEAVNCAAISADMWADELFGHVRGAFTDARQERQGRIAAAGPGTLFLDEIGEIPPDMQAMLLRVLQERCYSPLGSDQQLQTQCRFICATNRDLEEEVQAGRFREDLFYRMNVFTLSIPPLRERPADIAVLLQHANTKAAADLNLEPVAFSAAALQILESWTWPGNIRELENFMLRSVALHSGQTMEAANLPARMRQSQRSTTEPAVLLPVPDSENRTLREIIDDYTRRVLVETLNRTGGNRSEAARLLGIKRGSLLYRMKDLDIH
ncbi:MAG: sigma 54-interacting transcriptional regulator [Leptospiraceae bacterium]|nr:sigma 54-interacting transcriptional regulator [Leptospiraceae bacterium]